MRHRTKELPNWFLAKKSTCPALTICFPVVADITILPPPNRDGDCHDVFLPPYRACYRDIRSPFSSFFLAEADIRPLKTYSGPIFGEVHSLVAFQGGVVWDFSLHKRQASSKIWYGEASDYTASAS